MRFLANENLPGPVVEALRQLGHDVLWIKESMPGAGDSIVPSHAQLEHRIVVTLDKDFGELAFRAGLPAQCGVILIRLDYTAPDTDNRLVVGALRSRDDWAGNFAVIERDRIRIRPLPNEQRIDSRHQKEEVRPPKNTWIYFATSEKASLPETLGTVLNMQFLWRSARNVNGALIANVGRVEEGDCVVVAWRHSGGRRIAHLCCRVAAPLAPMESGLAIDRLAGKDAETLIAAGYPANAESEVEGIRLDHVLECHFEVQGTYAGNNALHQLNPADAEAAKGAGTIPHRS